MKGPIKDGDDVILCHRVSDDVTPDDRGLITTCEFCEAEMWAFPVSIERAKREDTHLICQQCFPEAQKHKGPAVFAGRIEDNKFPAKKD